MPPATKPKKHSVEGETYVASAPGAVWEVLSDFLGVGRWAPLVTRVVSLSEKVGGVGAARRCDLRGLGSVDEIVTVWEEGRRLGYRVSPLGPIGVSESLWEIREAGEARTRVKLRLEYEMRFGRLGAFLNLVLVRRLLLRNLPGALALLRRRVEAG